MYVPRQLESKVKPFLKNKEVIAITGPRQVGKTTFIKNLEKKLEAEKKKVQFITFEKRSDLELFENDIESFRDLVKEYRYFIIDEFQYAKEGGKKLKYLYDTTKTKFIISGSSSLELTFQTGKYMVGRMLNFGLRPFSFREYLLACDKELYSLVEKKIKSSVFKFDPKKGLKSPINERLAAALEEYIIYGGYPAVVLSDTTIRKQKVLEGIVDNYLLRDVRGLLNLATENELLRLSRFLAAQTGGIINFNELSNISGLSYKEVTKHLNILEKTYIIGLVKPFFKNKRTEISKNPKVYFIDSGVRNYLLSDFRSFNARNDAGAVMENYGYNLLKHLEVAPRLKYWRSKSKAEVDFVIEKEQTTYPVEIKYTSQRTLGKSFHSFLEKFKPPKGIVMTRDYPGEEKIKGAKVKFLPLTYF